MSKHLHICLNFGSTGKIGRWTLGVLLSLIAVFLLVVGCDIPPSAPAPILAPTQISAPSISASADTVTAVNGVAISAVTFTNNGGAVPSGGWSIEPALPAGLSFDPDSGAISGTPTEVAASQGYTVTATNAAGSDTATVTIQVTAAMPDIADLGTVSVVRGAAISGATFVNSGAAPTSCSVSTGTLPADLTIGVAGTTCAITGTVASSATIGEVMITVTATNDAGSETATLTIAVTEALAAPSISASADTVTAVNGAAISAVTFTNNGGAVPSGDWSIEPALAAGLSFDPDSGAISGTPTAAAASTVYTVTATNATGSDTATLTIAVTETLTVPSITASRSTVNAVRETAITAVTFTNSGGASTDWSISPDLPAGLSVDSNTGTISGTPTAATASTSYTVTATNATGSDTATLTIVVRGAPSISAIRSTVNAVKGMAIVSVTFTNSGGASTDWSISPDLPTGLSVDSNTGTISGTPTAATASTSYTVTATNSAGSATAEVTIAVTEPLAAPSITASRSTVNAVRETAITAVTFTNSGGASTDWSINPGLPAGLSIDSNTGEISGTPTAATASTSYTVTARNSTGSATATLTIVVRGAPSISAIRSTVNAMRGTAITEVTFSNSGGASTDWSISPGLPAGLSIDSNTGEISGTPTAVAASRNYTVTARNSAGNDTATLTIAVTEPLAAPSITASRSTVNAVNGAAITAVTFSNSGGASNNWSINPALPAGLSIDSDTGEISGTPTAAAASKSYTVTATNATGSDTATLTIVVDDCLATRLTACTVTVGSSRSGFIESTGDADWFGVSLTRNTSYRIHLDGPDASNFDLEIYYPDGTSTGVRGNRAGDESFNARISTSATYYIQVSGISGTGNYTLLISSDDCSASTSTSCTVTVGSSRSGSIDAEGDLDWFRVSLTRNRNYRIQIDGPDASNFDGEVRLSNGNSSRTSGTASGDEDFYYRPSTSATYYILVRGITGTGNYTLQVSSVANVPDDCGHTAATTTCTVAVGSSTTGSIEIAGDQDLFKVVLTGGNTYRIELDGPRGRNFDLRVFPPTGSRFITAEEYGDEDFTYQAIASGTYHIQIYKGLLGQNTGDYTLSVSIPDDCLASTSTTCTVTVGSSSTGSIETSGDRDMFKVSLTRSTTLSHST